MILVTGASGNVGGEVVKFQRKTQQSVRVLTRDASRVEHLEPGIERAIGNFDDRASLVAALDGVDHLFLMTSEIGTAHVENAVAAAKTAGVDHIVYLSSAGAATPHIQIGKWHHDREEIIRASGIGWTFLRPGMFASNALQWAPTIKTQGAIYSATGDAKSSPIHPGDIAAVAGTALVNPGHEGKAYELSGPQSLSIKEQAAILSTLLEKPIKVIEVPSSVMNDQMISRGMPQVLADAITELFDEVRNSPIWPPSNTVLEVTGSAPCPFVVWCQENLAAFK